MLSWVWAMTVTPICCEKLQNTLRSIMCMVVPTPISWIAYLDSVYLRGPCNRMSPKMLRVWKRITLKSRHLARKVKPKFWSFRRTAKAFQWCWRKMKGLRRRCDWAKDKSMDTKEPVFIPHDAPPYASGEVHPGKALNKIQKISLKRG